MSLLWKTAMAWTEQGRYNPTPRQGKPISVRGAGYAGYVSPHDPADIEAEEGDPHAEFDEDLYDSVTPEPTKEEHRHYEEHGEYPESHYERHDRAYDDAIQKRRDEDDPDDIDEGLAHFIGDHAHDSAKWGRHGTYGKVDLTKPVYATQSHVHTAHLDRYDADPQGTAWHLQHGGRDNDYPANKDPLFATHEGRLHVIDGHHRVGAALRRGDPHITGWHMDLDKHSHLTQYDEDQ